jgi:broad specificity polyphosphatase/5'/3'-nucleotidase SurE
LPFPAGLFFNVNVPASGHKIRGIKLTRHGMSGFKEFYRPSGEPGADGICYWQVDGKFQVKDPDDSYDAAALAGGHISVAPMILDMTFDPYRDAGQGRTKELRDLLDKLSEWR